MGSPSADLGVNSVLSPPETSVIGKYLNKFKIRGLCPAPTPADFAAENRTY